MRLTYFQFRPFPGKGSNHFRCRRTHASHAHRIIQVDLAVGSRLAAGITRLNLAVLVDIGAWKAAKPRLMRVAGVAALIGRTRWGVRRGVKRSWSDAPYHIVAHGAPRIH